MSTLTEDESAVVIADALSEVEVSLDGVTINGVEKSAEDRDVVVALK